MLLDADYERSPLDNIKDGISRELEYFAVNGDISYRHNGEKFDCTFDDVLSQKHQSLRLRTAISHGGTYYHYLHELGVKTFRNVQKDQKNAGLLVIADDKIGAENCANHLSNKFGLEVKVLTEETPNPTETLRRFNDGEADALVAVQMMTEGVNSPRLRVGVYLTRKTAALFVQQTMHRLSRKQNVSQKGPGIWIGPADPRLVEEVQRLDAINLITVEKSDDINSNLKAGTLGPVKPGTFVPISAVAQEVTGICGKMIADHYELKQARAIRKGNPQLYKNIGDVQLSQIAQNLAPQPKQPSRQRIETYDEVRKRLKKTASDLANRLAHTRNVEPREVHLEWISGGNDRHEDANNKALEAKISWLSGELEREQRTS